MASHRPILNDIEANLSALEIDEIKKRLEPLMKGCRIESPVFDPGAFLYRARRITPSFSKQIGIDRSSLIYPPREVAALGRMNRPGESVFYGSMHKESVFFEVQGLQPGDELVLTFWKTNEKMFVNNIGYTDPVFQRLGAKRPLPQWNPQSLEPRSNKETIALAELPPEVVQAALSQDDNREIREAFSEYFMRAVSPQENYRYKLTTAIGELHLGTITISDQQTRFAGVLYPSTRMWANGDNLALLPWFVDTHLEFRKALHVRIDSRTDDSISITYLDSAKRFDSHGTLVWLGAPSHWAVQPGQKAKFTAVAGLDGDGDYQMSTSGHPYHWIAVDSDTGESIEAR